MDIKKLLKELCEADYMGGVGNAADIAEAYLSQYASVDRKGFNIIGKISGDSQKSILLDAHIDEIGMMVTSVDECGFLKVAAAGGLDSRILAGMRVKIHGKQIVGGVFCSTPPHLMGDDKSAPKLDDMYIDTGLGKKALDIISVGDRVTFKQSFAELCGSRVTAKSLDDRAGVATLICVAEMLQGVKLPCDVYFLLSDQEETTEAGAKTMSFGIAPDKAIIVDVSFGDSPDIAPEKTGKLGGGAMIGVSPALSAPVCDELRSIAKECGIPHQVEVMGRSTGTNADVIASVGKGVRCSVVSIPLRNMHTPAEIIDINDIVSAAELIKQYILAQ